MYFLFRHLVFLSLFALVGLFVLGFALEKLSDSTTSMAIFGFSASIVHLAAFWFVLAPASPVRKAFWCVGLMVACLASVAFGRWLQVTMVQGPIDQWWENVRFITRITPAWWVLLVVETIAVKELFRWRLQVKDQTLTQQLTILDLFELTLILGIALGLSTSTLMNLIHTDYLWVGGLSGVVHIAICLPIARAMLASRKPGAGAAIVFAACLAGATGLLYLASFRFLSADLHALADLAIGVASFAGPFILALLFAREKQLAIVSQWCRLGALFSSSQASSEETRLLD